MTREEYIAALRSHDWYFQYSDDHSIWERGFDERSALRHAQTDLDGDYVLWNEHAPELFKYKEAV